MFFHCLSLSLSRLLLAAADLPDVVCCRFFVQFTLLCCTRHTTTDKELRLEAFQSLHCVAARARARALWVKVQLWWLFLCYFVNVKMFARILFFFLQCKCRALLCCHSLNAMFWCRNAVTLCWIWLALTVWSNKTSRTWSSGSLPTVSCLCKVFVFLTRGTQDFYRSQQRSFWSCISLCVAASFCRPKSGGNTEETQRLVLPTARCNWECTENVPADKSLVLCFHCQSNLLQGNKNTLLEIKHLTFKLAMMSRFRT